VTAYHRPPNRSPKSALEAPPHLDLLLVSKCHPRGHVWTRFRGGLDPLLSHGDDPDVSLCLNQQTMDVHQADVPRAARSSYESRSAMKAGSDEDPENVRLIGIPCGRRPDALAEPR